MRKRIPIKKQLAAMLAAAMVFTMAAPAAPTFALNYGDVSIIEFDPQAGPNLSHSSYRNMPRRTNGVSYATGMAGYALTASADFNGIDTQSFGSGARPELPQFDQGIEWPGYTFEGWYNSDGNKVISLPYAFDYTTPTTYTALWTGDSNVQFPFKTMHYRDFKEGRNSNTNGADDAAWPQDNDADILKFYEDGTWENHVTANTPISATYKRNIPGYKIDSILIKNNKNRRFDDSSGAGTLEEAASINSTTNSIRGMMPNDALTAAFRYVPDQTKKFALRVEYVNESGVAIKAPTSSSYSAESSVTAAPISIPGYIVLDGSVTSGDTSDLTGQGIYSATEAGYHFTDHVFSGNMPNQPVTVTYRYKIDTAYTTRVTVNMFDNHGNILEDAVEYSISPSDPVELAVPKKSGYIYPPNLVWDGNFTQMNMDETNQKLTFNSDISGGSVTFTYSEDLNDTTQWTRVEFYNSTDGTLSGDASPKSKRHGTYSIEELTQGMIPSPNEHYMFDGWYKANATGSGKTGSRLTGDVTLDGQNYKLFANFVENPNDWFNLNFKAGSHGRISGVSSLRVVRGTDFGDLSLPVTTADDNYLFAGWFDENGNRASDQLAILSNQTYTARFTLISGGDDGILHIPNAQGSIASDGTGQVKVNGANEFRKYVLTDADGMVINTLNGSQAVNGTFDALQPSTSYYVYEISQAAFAAAGDLITEQVDASAMSQPSMVIVPALGSNYVVSDDGNGTVKITVKPAAPDTLYSILDMTGTLVEQADADEGGWLIPGGSPLSVTFSGLEPNVSYTVVAKQKDASVSCEEQKPKGSTVLAESSSETNRSYSFKVTNGGYIENVTRNGQLLSDLNGAVTAQLKAGDMIKVNAGETDGGGQPFERWNVLLGSMDISFLERRNQTITMVSQDIVLQASYKIDSSLDISKAYVDYTPKNGSFALNTDEGRLQSLLTSLTQNITDSTELANGHKVEYTIKFDKNIPVASESNAIKALVDEDEDVVVVPWAVTTSMSRQVEGVNRPIPDDGQYAQAIEVYGKLDYSTSGYMDYRLWHIATDEDGSTDIAEIPMEVYYDNGEDAEFRWFSFDTNVGDKVLLSYSKTYAVKIYDTIRGTVNTIRVKAGEALEDADGFMDLIFHDDYTDPVSGVTWESVGLGSKATSQTLYDATAPVTKNLVLYAIYRQTDDSDWEEAKRKLQSEIDIANALKNNGTVSSENREILEDAVGAAVDVLNRIPRPTITDLKDAYDTLKNIVDNIRNNTNPDTPDHPDNPDHPDTPDEPDTPVDPDNPDHPGGGSGGGSGGNSGGSGSGVVGPGRDNGYKTYTNESDGNWNTYDSAGGRVPLAGLPGWNQLGENGDIWEFILNDGSKVKSQWINIRYYVDGETVTHTYHFNEDGKMNSGWFLDTDGKWYYLSTAKDSWFGHMVKGWHFSTEDSKWYYLNQFNGYMLTGWQKISGVWYYLSPDNAEPAWGYDELTKSWVYVNPAEHPLGSMYQSEITPDGYTVEDNGAWIRETPQ